MPYILTICQPHFKHILTQPHVGFGYLHDALGWVSWHWTKFLPFVDQKILMWMHLTIYIQYIYIYHIIICIYIYACASGSSIDFRLEVFFQRFWWLPLGHHFYGSFDISGTSDRPGHDRRSLQLCEGSIDPSIGFGWPWEEWFLQNKDACGAFFFFNHFLLAKKMDNY